MKKEKFFYFCNQYASQLTTPPLLPLPVGFPLWTLLFFSIDFPPPTLSDGAPRTSSSSKWWTVAEMLEDGDLKRCCGDETGRKLEGGGLRNIGIPEPLEPRVPRAPIGEEPVMGVREDQEMIWEWADSMRKIRSCWMFFIKLPSIFLKPVPKCILFFLYSAHLRKWSLCITNRFFSMVWVSPVGPSD